MFKILKHEIREPLIGLLVLLFTMIVATIVSLRVPFAELGDLVIFIIFISSTFAAFIFGFTSINATIKNVSLPQSSEITLPQSNYLFYSLPQKNSKYIEANLLIAGGFIVLTWVFALVCMAVMVTFQPHGNWIIYEVITDFVTQIFDLYALASMRLYALTVVLCFLTAPFALFGALIWAVGSAQRLFGSERSALTFCTTAIIMVSIIGESVVVYYIVHEVYAVIANAVDVFPPYMMNKLNWSIAILICLIFNAVWFTAFGLKHFNKNLNLE
jgi:hypothetical protein